MVVGAHGLFPFCHSPELIVVMISVGFAELEDATSVHVRRGKGSNECEGRGAQTLPPRDRMDLG